VVDDGANFVQAEVRRGHERLPDLPFLELAVTGHHVNAPRALRQAIGQHHALGLGDAHTERAGVGDHTRCANVGVTRQAVQLPQSMNGVERQALERDEQRVKPGRVVTFGGEVQVLPVGLAQRFQMQPGHDVQARKGTADVAGARAGYHVQRVQTASIRQKLRAPRGR